jgi:hypothetical protein
MFPKFISLLILPLSLIALAMPALADSGKGNSGKAPQGQSGKVAPSVGTPPGLAKKPLGMPPGQAKKIYRAGDHLPNGYTWIDDLGRWRLPPLRPGEGYVRYDNEVYRVVRDTAVVLEALGIVSDLLN